MIPLPLVALVLGGLALWVAGQGDGPVAEVLADFLATVTGRGSRVGPATAPDANGIVLDDPRALANEAGQSLDVYALARMISSEEGNSATLYKVAVAFAAKNHTGGRPAEVLTAGKGIAAGHFKRQGYRYPTSPADDNGVVPTAHAAAYASTVLDPREDDIAIARAVLGGELTDPTGGATNFFRPGLQDTLYFEGKVTRDADAVRADWTSGNLREVTIDGVDAGELAFFGPAGGDA